MPNLLLDAPSAEPNAVTLRREAVPVIGRLRARWRRAVLLRGWIWAAVSAVAAVLLLVLVDLVQPLPAGARLLLRWLPLVAFALVALAASLRAARPPSVRRLALLAEERQPHLQNRLLTVLTLPPVAGGVVAAAFRHEARLAIGRVDARVVVPLRARRSALALATLCAVAAIAAASWPSVAAAAWQRWRTPADAYPSVWNEVRADAAPLVAPPTAPPGFAELRWRVQPPAYTGLPARGWSAEPPTAVLPGTRIDVRSRYFAEWTAVRAEVAGGGALPVQQDGGEWRTRWTVRPGDRGLVLAAVQSADTVARRVVALATATDQPPQVSLVAPEADMVLAAPRGRIPIRATARDDYGIGSFDLVWIRSGGGGESFSFAEGRLTWDRVARRDGVLTGEFTLDLAALGAQPGDLLHLRAVARDRNTVTGPGEGVSETRIIRIAQPDEMHTVTTLIGAPAELEKNPILSQRMLILLTERLRDRLPRMAREDAAGEATDIAGEQGRLRARVGEQIFSRSTGGIQQMGAEFSFEDGSDHHDDEGPDPARPDDVLKEASRATGTGTVEELGHRHDEAPIIDINRPLLNAYNSMWAAERALNQVNPAGALPHQSEALKWLQEAQQGERLYARAQPSTPPVDVAAARGTGKLDEAAPANRAPRLAVATAAAHLAELDGIASRLRTGRRDAGPALAELAARVLADPRADPRAADHVARAADAARAGDLIRARREIVRARAFLSPDPASGSAAPLPTALDAADAEYFRRLGPSR